jgi:hypothetical protein
MILYNNYYNITNRMSDVASEVVMYVSLTELKNTFQFCTKATGFVSLDDTKYYVFRTNGSR